MKYFVVETPNGIGVPEPFEVEEENSDFTVSGGKLIELTKAEFDARMEAYLKQFEDIVEDPVVTQRRNYALAMQALLVDIEVHRAGSSYPNLSRRLLAASEAAPASTSDELIAAVYAELGI